MIMNRFLYKIFMVRTSKEFIFNIIFSMASFSYLHLQQLSWWNTAWRWNFGNATFPAVSKLVLKQENLDANLVQSSGNKFSFEWGFLHMPARDCCEFKIHLYLLDDEEKKMYFTSKNRSLKIQEINICRISDFILRSKFEEFHYIQTRTLVIS